MTEKYLFRSFPVPVLSYGWYRDAEWERNTINKIRNGQAAPKGLSLSDLAHDGYWPAINAEDWERTEERSKNADRRNSLYLSDEAIAKRSEQRKTIKTAREEKKIQDKKKREENRVLWGAQRIEREAREAVHKAEIDEQYRVWEERRAENLRKKVQYQEEWNNAAPQEQQHNEHCLINSIGKTWKIYKIKWPVVFLYRDHPNIYNLIEYWNVNFINIDWELYYAKTKEMMDKEYGARP
jgi:hypothetical protein